MYSGTTADFGRPELLALSVFVRPRLNSAYHTMDKKEIRVLIKYCFLMGKNTIEAKQCLDKRYGDSAPGKLTIIDWYAEYKRGRTNTDNAGRSGRPKSAVFPEYITKVHKMVLGDRKLKFFKWVPCLLIPDQA